MKIHKKIINKLLLNAITTGKRVRSETNISLGKVSIPSTSINLLKQIEPEYDKLNITIIGAGTMGRLLLINLDSKKINNITIINRSNEKIKKLQDEFPNININNKSMNELIETINNSNIIFIATTSPSYIINYEDLNKNVEKKIFIDISVPSNIDPKCKNISNIFIYNIDDLKKIIDYNKEERYKEIINAEIIIKEEIIKFNLWKKSIYITEIISKINEELNTIQTNEIDKISKNITEKELNIILNITNKIYKKLIHVIYKIFKLW